MHSQLDAVSLKVSASCKSFLDRSKRRSDCYPNAVYGAVEGVRVWNVTASGDVVMHELVLPNVQIDICTSTKFNIESINQPCVSNAVFVLSGPENHRREERVAPFALFGDDNADFYGSYLDIGLYNVSITPDKQPSKTKVFKLMMKNC